MPFAGGQECRLGRNDLAAVRDTAMKTARQLRVFGLLESTGLHALIVYPASPSRAPALPAFNPRPLPPPRRYHHPNRSTSLPVPQVQVSSLFTLPAFGRLRLGAEVGLDRSG